MVVTMKDQEKMKCSSPIRVLSYGGGVQSTALLVLAAQGKIDYKTFLFCNVGDDSEHPDTLKYVHEVAMPYAAQHALQLLELQRVRRDGETETLYSRLTKPNSKSIGIPVRMNNSGAPGRRSCTADFKITVVDRWLREHGAKASGAVVGLGISLDELQRMKPNMDPDTLKWKENVFPLIDLRIDRAQCIRIIHEAGLPIPPKSSCWFCPYHRLSVWQEMRQNQPELFWKAAKLEAFLNERRRDLGMDEVWLTRMLVPLARATTDMVQMSLFEDDDEICESGHCFM